MREIEIVNGDVSDFPPLNRARVNYDLEKLEVGQYMECGDRSLYRGFITAAARHNKRHGTTIRVRVTPDGFRVYRYA